MSKPMQKQNTGEIFRKYRLKNELTQEQLAERIDVSPGFIGQIERNETYPSFKTLKRYIQCLKADANDFFYEEGYERNRSYIGFYHQLKSLTEEHQAIIRTLMNYLETIEYQKKQ